MTDPSLWWDLLLSLTHGECSAVRLADGTIEVTWDRASDEHSARLELAFFLRAWQSRHPDVTLEVVPDGRDGAPISLARGRRPASP